MNAIIYARVSSDAQDVELSIGAQIRTLREYAERNGHRVVREFVDEAQSGRSAHRPAFRQMIEFARSPSHLADAIIVWKLNRFARDRMDSVTYKHLLKRAGVEVISINEPVDDSPSGRMMTGIIETIDEFYSANLGQDISRGMREAASLGFFVGSIAPYGYRKRAAGDEGRRQRWTLEPDEAEAVNVRMMFGRVAGGIGLRRLATELMDRGILSRSGAQWTTTSLYKLLTREVYTGTLVWGSSRQSGGRSRPAGAVRSEGAWPALVERELFDRVQEALRSRAPLRLHPRVASSPYLLSGIVYCGRCGRAMTGHSAKSGRNHYYLCSMKNKAGSRACGQPMTPRSPLENAILDRTRKRLLSTDNLEKLVRMVNEEVGSAEGERAERLAAVEKETRDVERRLMRYYEAFETGSLSAEQVGPRLDDLKERLGLLTDAKVDLEVETA